MTQLHACPACGSQQLSAFIKVAAQMHSEPIKFNFDQCEKCRLVMLNPRLSPELLQAYYTDAYMPYRGARAWGRYAGLVSLDQQQLDRKRVRMLKRIKKLSAATTILDVGCGRPTFLHTAHQRFGTKGIGVDFSDHGWGCREKQYPELDLYLANPREIQLQEPPDFITMWHYLEHDYFPGQTLTHLAALSDADTRLVIEVPSFTARSRKKYAEYWAGWHAPRHTFLFSSDNLCKLLEKSGWHVQDIQVRGTLSDYLLYWMSEMEVRKNDWTNSMEPYFWPFVIGQFKHWLQQFIQHKPEEGYLLVTAKPA